MNNKLTAAEALEVVGRALYGDEWKSPMARMMGVRRDTVQYWLNGRMELATDHPALLQLLEKLTTARDALAAVTKPPPSKPRKEP